ncbi:hypothetical protein G7Y79_00002g007810 [Physcia stellaris]|nr:hypothetical protein G7Y79_00002g007810 [Physcia stellaris]
MCYYGIVVYKDCRHPNSESVTPCSRGADAIKERCMVSILENRVADPGTQTYCRSCYCKIEKEICKAGDQMIRGIDADIQAVFDFQNESEGKHLEHPVRDKNDPDGLEVTTSRCEEAFEDALLLILEREEDVLETQNWKERQLQEFRESQGVCDDDWVRVEPEFSCNCRVM